MDGLNIIALAQRFTRSGWDQDEAARLAELINLFLQLPDPPDPDGSFPDHARLRDLLAVAVDGTARVA